MTRRTLLQVARAGPFDNVLGTATPGSKPNLERALLPVLNSTQPRVLAFPCTATPVGPASAWHRHAQSTCSTLHGIAVGVVRVLKVAMEHLWVYLVGCLAGGPKASLAGWQTPASPETAPCRTASPITCCCREHQHICSPLASIKEAWPGPAEFDFLAAAFVVCFVGAL
jgi:hypothetical protein